MLASFWNLVHLYSKNKNFKISNIQHNEEYYISKVKFYKDSRGIIHMKMLKGKKELVIYTHRKNIVCLYEIENISFSFENNQNLFFTEADSSPIDYLMKNFDFENILEI
jgi:hypothetical protein